MGVFCFHNRVIGTIGIGIENYCRTSLELNGTAVCILTWCAVIICSIFVAYIYEPINEQICDTAQFCLLHKEYQSIFAFAPRTNDISFCVNWKIYSLIV